MKKKIIQLQNIKQKWNERALVPKGYINDLKGWGFSKKVIKKNIGKLLTLDIDVGRRCSLNCSYCFRKNNKVDYKREDITAEDMLCIVKAAKELGLKTVKILGAGEPFENEDFLWFLENLNDLGIITAIFTKGHVFSLMQEKVDFKDKFWFRVSKFLKNFYRERYSIDNGKELLDKVYNYNASIILGFNTFSWEVQDKMVGRKGYSYYRDEALKLLVERGFNKFIEDEPTRLSLGINPVTNDNYSEVFDIYKWARNRNIYPVVTTSMVSGRAEKNEFWKSITPSKKKLEDLYFKIYKYNIMKGISKRSDLIEDRLSAYVGGRPCNQISSGMYLTLTGIVLRCPGDDTTKFGIIEKQDIDDKKKLKKKISEIWENSENYNRSGMYNCGCPPKYGKTIPYGLLTDVLKKII